MAEMSMSDLSEKMRDIDFCILATHGDGGQIAGRPMSNNREVDYGGDSFFFTWEKARMISEIERDPKVALSYQGSSGILGQRPFMAHIEGQAELVRDKGRFAEHWTSDLDRWFEQGVDTPGVVMIKVHAARVHYWDGMDEGEIAV
ncbi:pyridoxamine 5'-phosphate oxidase family protein [Flaviflagellibacter deserti]|uniref:Pyridoxamine 5'-phosphate oxidase family protein n=1 Tax=Flaviflagellibacter deserti TaxID=2267266 RepID=A0ABV9Z267_9HYPH